MISRILIVCFLITSFGLISCQSGKKVSYFLSIPDSVSVGTSLEKDAFVSPKIRVGDLLGIQIYTIDPSTAEIINPSGGSRDGNPASRAYRVDDKGEVSLPLVGPVRLVGLDLSQAGEAISTKAERNLVDPVVLVRFAHFPVTVLGEVTQPGLFQSPSEKISVLQALGLAGDLSPQARRDNVLLIREVGDKSQVVFRYNLNDHGLFSSPYYYLHPGDVLYVSPNKAKARSSVTDTTRDRYVSYLISGATLLLSVVSLIMINNNR